MDRSFVERPRVIPAATKSDAARPRTSKQRVASKLYNLTLDVNALKQEVAALDLQKSLLIQADHDPTKRVNIIGPTTRDSSVVPKRRRDKRRPATAISARRPYATIQSLSLVINVLHEQTHSLQQHRSLLMQRALASQRAADGSILRSTSAYFAAFRRGFQPLDRHQAALAHALIVDDVAFGPTIYSRDTVLEQWRRYTECFGKPHFEVPSPEITVSSGDTDEIDGGQSGTSVVRTELTFRGRFTWMALEVIFPAVLKDPSLIRELLCKAMEATVVLHMYYNRQGRVVRYDMATPFFEMLTKALGDPVRAAAILRTATIADECMLYAGADDGECTVEPVERVRFTGTLELGRPRK